ncbi:hypothetical protein ABFY48_24525 [Lysinibacillus pakistanensis]
MKKVEDQLKIWEKCDFLKKLAISKKLMHKQINDYDEIPSPQILIE